MSYGEKRPRVVPPVPSSLNPHAWDVVDLDTPQNRSAPPLRPHAHTDPSITPYLGLRARLSQLWFNRWTVLLLLILARVLMLSGSLTEDVKEAGDRASSACRKVEDIGSTMASMPHYLSVGVNNLAAERIAAEVGTQSLRMEDILTIVEGIIVFAIDMYFGLMACIVLSLVHTGLDVSVQIIDGAKETIDKQIATVAGQLSENVVDVQKVLDNARNSINNLIGFSGQNIDIPTIDISKQLEGLKGVSVADVLSKELSTLNKTIPNFNQLKNVTQAAVSVPFAFIRERLDKTYSTNQTFLNPSSFPVAEKQALTFCSDNTFLGDFFDSLQGIINKAKTAFLVAIPILAILAIVVMGWLEIRRWHREKQRARVFTEQGYDPMDVVYIASRPMTANAGIRLSSKFSGKKKVLARWFVAYGTSLPALFVLSLAIAGLLSCLFQYFMLQALQKEVPKLTGQVGGFADRIVQSLESVSTDWATVANAKVEQVETEMNDDLFGFIRNATKAVNETLNAIDKGARDEITKELDNTILEKVALDFVACAITRKVESFEKGVKWVQDKLKVSLPRFQNDLFSAGANESISDDSDLQTFLASPSTVSSDEVSSEIQKVIGKVQSGIIQEMLISLALLLVYIIIVLFGAASAGFQMARRDSTRGVGGERYGVKQGGDYETRNPANGFGSFENREEVVNAGNARRSPEVRFNTHARKSSYPEVEESGR
ncbi:plasma membrane fusion protein PRM1 [Podospora fimiseda]|uniref:Plasma membrane fusion protein PRM1 n=1 Tax=Podospora fimiseda TaxID=252190 RepID=A0AAN7H0C0_9PEZI|nr:plasma membrane fusion protein PRM1 [Podospora fimiseda]